MGKIKHASQIVGLEQWKCDIRAALIFCNLPNRPKYERKMWMIARAINNMKNARINHLNGIGGD